MQPRALFHAVLIDELQGDGDYPSLPEGMAMRLPAGQRWSADVHYINTTEQTVLVNNAFNLGLIPANEVTRWISSFEHDIGVLDIPPGGEFSASFDCPVGEATSILSLSTHMHSYGTQYRIELVRSDGSTQLLVDVPNWDADYRYQPPRGDFQPGRSPSSRATSSACDVVNGTGHHAHVPDRDVHHVRGRARPGAAALPRERHRARPGHPMTLALLLVAACAPPAATPDSADPGLPGSPPWKGSSPGAQTCRGTGGTLPVGLFFDPRGSAAGARGLESQRRGRQCG